MKLYRLYIPFMLIMFIAGCGGENLKKETDKMQNTSSITAVYKNCEPLPGNEMKLIFRRLDNCEYMIFRTDAATLHSSRSLILTQESGRDIISNDNINLRFEILYREESSAASEPERSIFNRLIEIKRSQCDRFSAAGIDNDIEADTFVLNLKEYLKSNDMTHISQMISYPLTVSAKRSRIKITNSDEFSAKYSSIINSRLINAVINQPVADIKASPKGLMLGNGEIWINSVEGRILITAINNS